MNFEEMRSMNQELTFTTASDAFKKYGVDFSKKNIVYSELLIKMTIFTLILQ